MMVNRVFEPLAEMDTIARKLDQPLSIFDINPLAVRVSQIPIDLYETSQDYVVQVYLPGFQQDAIHLELKDHELSIRAERRLPDRENVTWLQVESAYGTFHRSIQLGAGIQEDRVEAAWHNGMLVVRIPKAPEKQAKVIPIQTQQAEAVTSSL
jgi:HSP20 family protein